MRLNSAKLKIRCGKADHRISMWRSIHERSILLRGQVSGRLLVLNANGWDPKEIIILAVTLVMSKMEEHIQRVPTQCGNIVPRRRRNKDNYSAWNKRLIIRPLVLNAP